MAEFDLESIIKRGVEKALNTPVHGGKTISEWAAIGIKNGGGWISVKDRLPEKNWVYIIYNGENVFPAYYERGRRKSEWTDNYEGYCDFEATHWMPLPAPPKEGEEE